MNTDGMTKETVVQYARRYAYLRERDLSTIAQGGVFAGMTPKNVVLNGDDLDKAIDAEMEGQPKIGEVFCAGCGAPAGWECDEQCPIGAL